MAIDHSRLGLENKFLGNKSGRIFFVFDGLLYKFLPTIKNWLTFLNFNLFNQNIVNSQAAMTVNYDKASPSAHM